MEFNSNLSKVTKTQIAAQLGNSDSTTKRYRVQKHMPNPYNIKKHKKKKRWDPKIGSITSTNVEGGSADSGTYEIEKISFWQKLLDKAFFNKRRQNLKKQSRLFHKHKKIWN